MKREKGSSSRNAFQVIACKMWVIENAPEVWKKIREESYVRYPSAKNNKLGENYSFLKKVKP